MSIFFSVVEWFSSQTGTALEKTVEEWPSNIAKAVTLLLEKGGKKAGSVIVREFSKAWTRETLSAQESLYHKRIVNCYGHQNLLGHRDIDIAKLHVELELSKSPGLMLGRQSAQAIAKNERKSLKLWINELTTINKDKFSRTPRKGARIVIEGHPGSGKTTALRNVLLTSQAELPDVIPIYITLKNYSPEVTLWDLLTQELETSGIEKSELFLTILLQSGRAILLLDGVDEIATRTDMSRLRAQIETLSRKYEGIIIVISIRIASSDFTFGGFQYLRVSPFGKKEVSVFLENWFKEIPDKSFELLNQLLYPINSGIQELTKTPLLLSLVCLAFENSNLINPIRAELYEEAITVLLKTWDRKRGVERVNSFERLTPRRKEQLLCLIAKTAFENHLDSHKTYLEFSARSVAYCIRDFFSCIDGAASVAEQDAEDVLRSLESQNGLVIETWRRNFSFLHSSLHEYFIASYFESKNSNDEYLKLIRDYRYSDRAREVLLLISELTRDPNLFFECFTGALSNELPPDLAKKLTEIAVILPKNINQSLRLMIFFDLLYYLLTMALLKARPQDDFVILGTYESDYDAFFLVKDSDNGVLMSCNIASTSVGQCLFPNRCTGHITTYSIFSDLPSEQRQFLAIKSAGLDDASFATLVRFFRVISIFASCLAFAFVESRETWLYKILHILESQKLDGSTSMK